MKVNKRSNDFTNFNIGATQEAQENASAIEEATSNKEIVQIPIEDIEFNPNNTRFRDIDTDEEIETVNPGKLGQQVKMKLPIKAEENWIIRRKK